jgi:hypothetical protein
LAATRPTSRNGDRAVGLFLRLGHDAVLLRQHLLGLLDFVGYDDAHLVDNLKHAVLIDDDVVGKRHCLRVVE